jgi:putative aldouronate transport system permease protein
MKEKAEKPIKIKKENRIRKFTRADFVILFFLTLFGLLIIYPFYNTILVSIVPQLDYARAPLMFWPKRITGESFEFVFQSPILLRSMRTSTMLMFGGTLFNMILTTTLAYALTKRLPGRRLIRFLLVFTMYFGGGLIPYYLLIKGIGLMDTYMVMVLPSVVSVTYLLIISSYFSSLPSELIESAAIDGAGELRILLTIILPLSLPILATFTLYYGVERWNEWWHGMLFIKDIKKWPLQLALRQIISDATFISTTEMNADIRPPTYAEGIKMATIVVTMFPLMLVYPFLQRYFLTGLTLGAVKG